MTESISRRSPAFWLVLLAAGGAFALTMGARQSMGLYLNTLNTATSTRGVPFTPCTVKEGAFR